MLYFNQKLNTVVTTNNGDDLDYCLESFIREHFKIKDFAHRGFHHFIQRQRDHGTVVSEYKSPHILDFDDFEWEMNHYLEMKGIYGQWDKMFIIASSTSLEKIKAIAQKYKMWIFNRMVSPKIMKYYPQDRIVS